MPSKIAERSGRTRTSEIIDVLRTEILNAKLLPGQRLRFDALREQYDVGMSPLREALTRLAGDGLVTLEEHKGFTVALVSKSDLTDLVRLRSEIESLAIGWAISNGGDAWEGHILACLHELGKKTKLTEDGEIDFAWEESHQRFHSSLVAACGSERLLGFRQVLSDQATRYRRLSVHYLKAPRDDLAEHRELAYAVLERRASDATYLIRRHFALTAEIVLEGDPNLRP